MTLVQRRRAASDPHHQDRQVSRPLHDSATIAVVGQVPVSRLWHAMPGFPSISEVRLHLLEAYQA